MLKYPVLWKEAVVRVAGLNSIPTLFGNHALKLWSFVPSGHTSQLHLTVLRPRRKTFPNKQGTPGVWLQKEGRLFHTVSSGTGTETHSASAGLPRGTSATKMKTYKTRKVYFEDFIFAFLPCRFRNHNVYIFTSISYNRLYSENKHSKLHLRVSVPDYFKSVLEGPNFKFPLPPTRRLFSILSSLPCL